MLIKVRKELCWFFSTGYNYRLWQNSTSIIKVWNTLSLLNQMYKVRFYVHNTMIETLEGLVILYRMSYLVYIYLLCYTSKCGFLYNKVNQQRYNLFLFLFFMNNKDVIWYLFMRIVLRKIQCLFVYAIYHAMYKSIEYIQFYVPKKYHFIFIKI